MRATKKTTKKNIAVKMFFIPFIFYLFYLLFISRNYLVFFGNRQQSNARAGPKSNASAHLKQGKNHSGLNHVSDKFSLLYRVPPIAMHDYGCYGQPNEITLADVPERLESDSSHGRWNIQICTVDRRRLLIVLSQLRTCILKLIKLYIASTRCFYTLYSHRNWMRCTCKGFCQIKKK